MLPNYKNCPVNLACSILKEFGAPYTHATLPVFDALLAKRAYKNVVVILLDGMGMDALERHLAPDGFFRRNLKSEMTSVFPPTTVAATTSVTSGLTPVEHGWLGWTLYFEELDKLVNVFPNVEKNTLTPAADYHVAGRYMPFQSVFEKIDEAGVGHGHTVVPFGEDPVESEDEFFAKIARLCREDGRKYVYAYWADPDGLMHDHGCTAPVVTECMRRLEEKVEALATDLTDTLLVVTADHGHLDTGYYLVTDYPGIAAMLERPLSIESRAAVFYVKDEYMESFPTAFREAFGRDFVLFSRDEVKRMGLFGDGIAHPKFDAFLGDFLAAATGEMSLNYSRASRRFVSNHAGLHAREMRIPFIAFARP
ncbi:MAG TPA: alkaline phosphatase family protein [Clostridia bacterium]|nr:alkaline phosphatase family protein [Clostridia bacterium]